MNKKSTALQYKGRPLQAEKFSRRGLVITGRQVVCCDLGEAFMVKGVVSGNLWTYSKNMPGDGLLVIDA